MKNRALRAVAHGGVGSVSSLDIIARTLNRGEGAMKKRYQDPSILRRSDVKRPFYYVLVSVPIVTSEGLVRKRQSFPLGFCDEITMGEAKARKQQILAPVNADKFIIQSQIRFGDLAKKFEDVRIHSSGPPLKRSIEACFATTYSPLSALPCCVKSPSPPSRLGLTRRVSLHQKASA